MATNDMNSGNLLITGCTIVTPLGAQASKGSDMGRLLVVKNATIAIVKGIIAYAGPDADFNASVFGDADYRHIKADGKVVMPGFVDSHTHALFGGFRPDEFSWRLNGESYMSIMERGGGIQSTVNATREESTEGMTRKTEYFIHRMIEMGVTTVEIKSGYGLDVETEAKMLDTIAKIKDDSKSLIDVVTTFLGAHAVPAEYKGRTGEYVDLMINEMLPAFKDKAEFCDIFCEKNVFEIEDSRRFMQAAKDSGYKLKFHADEIVQLGGAELAVELGSISADHLLHVSDEGVAALASSDTVATLLPLTAFALKEPYAPARKMIDAGCAVALATDLNPGSCFSGSIPLTIALGCIYMGMKIEEVITALTLNGAAALGLADKTGSIEVGKRGNIVMLGSDNYNVLPYYVGMNCVRSTIHDGNIVYVDKN